MATLKQLTTFVAVAEYKNMSEAAKHLYISQPTVSQIIADLEKEYDTILFERKPKSLSITPAGQLLLNSSREIIAIHENLDLNMKNINFIRPLRVGGTMTVGNTIISKLISGLMAEHTDIDVSVCIDNTKMIEKHLIHNTLDIALVEGIIVNESIITIPAIEDQLVVICSTKNPLSKKNSLSLEDLKNQNIIMREKGSGTRAILENLLITHHIPYVAKWECHSDIAIMDAIRHNIGIGVLSTRSVTDFASKKEIHAAIIEGTSLKRTFYICYNQYKPMTSQMQHFIELTMKSH